MYKLGFEEAEELEVKLPTFTGSWKKRQNSRGKKKIYALLIRLKHFTLRITANRGKFLETGIPNYISCLLRSLSVGQEATIDWFKIEKRVQQGFILSSCLFYLYAIYIMWSGRLNESQAGIEIAGRNIKNLRYAGDATPIGGREEELKSLFIYLFIYC